MARFELKLPKMGESVAEATITNWLKSIGDSIEEDEAILEIATDKVDSEVPSEVDGVLKEILFEKDEVVKIGETLAIIETEDDEENVSQENGGEQTEEENKRQERETESSHEEEIAAVQETVIQAKSTTDPQDFSETSRFYSPLVKNIAEKEQIELEELEQLKGSGKSGRVTKDDILAYVRKRKNLANRGNGASSECNQVPIKTSKIPVNVNAEDEVIEMSRMGKMIAHHMVESTQTAAHVQSFIEVDVTKIWQWRNKVKEEFQQREGEKLTFTPIFMEAVVKAIKDFPLINISVNGDKIIKRKKINLGMAAALANGNLIVPVIKNADQLNLVGMAKAVNDLASRAREGKLKPDDTQGGTYTVTNVGTFGSVMGTPIINQPQVGILALGAIRKVPAVIETPNGDFIGIRHKMFLSHSYDHRVVNGALGGQFVQRVAQYLEGFDEEQLV